MVFLGLCIFVIDGVTFEYMCDIRVEMGEVVFWNCVLGCLDLCLKQCVWILHCVLCFWIFVLLVLWLFDSQ